MSSPSPTTPTPPVVALMVPATSAFRPTWTSVFHTYMLKLFLPGIRQVLSPNVEYRLYFGYDTGDRLFDNAKNRGRIRAFMKKMPVKMTYTEVELVGCEAGHVTKMWNMLFERAVSDGCDYFLQTGDDIQFKTKGWIQECIDYLKSNDGWGVIGPRQVNGASNLITQAFVSRRHWDTFGFFFPPAIKNWHCDNWITNMYAPSLCNILQDHFFVNSSFNEKNSKRERYVVDQQARNTFMDLVRSMRPKLLQQLPADLQAKMTTATSTNNPQTVKGPTVAEIRASQKAKSKDTRSKNVRKRRVRRMLSKKRRS